MAFPATRQSVATLRSLLGSGSRLAPLSVPRSVPVFRRIAGRPYKLRVFDSSRGFHHGAVLRSEALARSAESSETAQPDSDVVATTFQDLETSGKVDKILTEVLTDSMKLSTMTDIQRQTIDECLRGNNVLAQAKTGTGKTLGFLVPSAQRILASNPELAQRSRRERIDIKALIVSPTRELAEQIAAEARRLLVRTGIKVQTAVGGTQKNQHIRRMREEGCHLLVGTPGRLNDLLSDRGSGVDISRCETFIMDEADRLLDDGFSEELEQIHSYLPKGAEANKLQTLMFSATMPREVMNVVRKFMGRDYAFIKTVQEDEVPTHERVPQKMVKLAGLENLFPSLLELIKKGVATGRENGRPFKAICFFNANAAASLHHEMFQNLGEAGSSRFADHPLGNVTLLEIHSKLTQAQRTRNADLFRRSKEAVFFSSDVVARGMDFPDVTHVIQIGLARDRESYIHRIGRTGRAGKEGEGWLFLTGMDEPEARYVLKGLPIGRDRTLQAAGVDMTQDGPVPAEVNETLTQAINAAKRTTFTAKSNCFRAYFGTHQFVRDKRDLVENMNRMAEFGWGLERPPAVSMSLASKLGLQRVRSLNTDVAADQDVLDQEEEEALQRERERSRNRFGGRGGGSRFDSRGRGFGQGRDSGRGSDRRSGGRDGGRDGGRGFGRSGGRSPREDARRQNASWD